MGEGNAMERTHLLAGAPSKQRLSTFDYLLIVPCLLANMFLAAFENTIAASTMSSIGAEFRATENIAWVATSYLIVSTAVQPLYGRASDLFGRTKVYVFSLTFFAVGCLGCGASKNLSQMILARAICGIGGGGLITISQVCAWDILAPKSRPLYQALNNVAYGVGAAVGACSGGLLADTVGWRWGYLAPVPVSVISVIVFLLRARPILAFVHESKKTIGLKDIDFLGGILLMLAITALNTLVLEGGSSYIFIFTLSSLFLIIAIVFIRHEAKFPLPVLPLKLVTTRHMVSQVGLNIFGAMTIFGTLYAIPVYFESVHLTSASIASRRLLYPTITAPSASILTGIFLHRHPDKYHVGQRIGASLLLLGTISMLYLTWQDESDWNEIQWIFRLIGVHLGMGILFISSLLDVLATAEQDHASAVSLIFLLRSLGTVFGISGSQAIMQGALASELAEKITGPNASKIIKAVRQSTDYVRHLDSQTQVVVIDCYNMAFRAAFVGLVVASLGAVLSAVIGIGTRKNEAEEQRLPG